MACSYPAAVANQWISHGICCTQGPEETRPCGTCVCDDGPFSFLQFEMVTKSIDDFTSPCSPKDMKRKRESGRAVDTDGGRVGEGVLLRLGPVLRIPGIAGAVECQKGDQCLPGLPELPLAGPPTRGGPLPLSVFCRDPPRPLTALLPQSRISHCSTSLIPSSHRIAWLLFSSSRLLVHLFHIHILAGPIFAFPPCASQSFV